MITDVVHHVDKRYLCDGCGARVYDWADELDAETGAVLGHYCRPCSRVKRGQHVCRLCNAVIVADKDGWRHESVKRRHPATPMPQTTSTKGA